MTCDTRKHDGRRRREETQDLSSLEAHQNAVAVALSETPWQRVVEFEWRMIW